MALVLAEEGTRRADTLAVLDANDFQPALMLLALLLLLLTLRLLRWGLL